MKRWKKLKPKQFAWIRGLIALWLTCITFIMILHFALKEPRLQTSAKEILGIGIVVNTIILCMTRKTRKMSSLMEKFIRRNGLYQAHNEQKYSTNGKYKVECIDYYPKLEYREMRQKNMISIRIRLDGSLLAEKFRNMEQALADMLRTNSTDKIEERGYLIYNFEIHPQKQIRIQTQEDIQPVGSNEIVFSRDIVWNWKMQPHLLLAGETGSGKTQLLAYIITCLLKQGVRVIYCDPKNDDDMREFMKHRPAVYVTEINDIARVVRETESEMRHREADLQKIGYKEYDFKPVFIIFDEMIAFSKIADKKTYEETMKRLYSIILQGRSKRTYVCAVMHRPDVVYCEGAIRENLSCRICMGQMSDTAYQMAFGSDFRNVKNQRHAIGSGLIYRQGIDTKPREFIAPFICKGALLKP